MDGTSDIGFKQHLGGTDSNDDEIFTNNPNPSIQDICDEDNDEDSEEPFLDSDIDFDGILNIYSENGDGDSNMDNDGFNNYPDDGTIYNVNNFLFYDIDDLDNDGIPTYDENGNILDDDIDGDGCKNQNDYDVDGDGVYEDIDEDGIYNKDDNDIDGDGIDNNNDNDENIYVKYKRIGQKARLPYAKIMPVGYIQLELVEKDESKIVIVNEYELIKNSNNVKHNKNNEAKMNLILKQKRYTINPNHTKNNEF